MFLNKPEQLIIIWFFEKHKLSIDIMFWIIDAEVVLFDPKLEAV